RLLTIKDRHAQTGARQLQRHGSANHSTARDGHIELLHSVILAQPAEGILRSRTSHSANSVQREVRRMWIANYSELARSSESTCAFFARLRARLQPVICAASRASLLKLALLHTTA